MTGTPTPPVDPIGAAEDAILVALRTAFGATMKEIVSIPARLDEDELVRILHTAPGLYLAFLGGQRKASDYPGLTLTTVWGVYCVTAQPASEQTRRRGDGRSSGAYAVMAHAAGTLDRLALPGIGTLELVDCVNLFAQAFVKNGRTVYGLVLHLPLSLPSGVDPCGLPPFQTFAATWNFDGETAADTVTLQGA